MKLSIFRALLRKRWLSGALIMASVAIHNPACSAGTTPAKTSLSMVGPWELSSLEPSRTGYMFQRMQVAETLVGVDVNGRAVSGLAQQWKVSADQLRWRFVLRPGAKFHDGTMVTPASVAQNLQRAWKQAGGVLYMAPITAISETADGISITLAKPYARLPMLLAHSTTIILAPTAYGSNGRVAHMIGSGPYQLVHHVLPQQLDFALSPYWNGKQPHIRTVRYLSVSRSETRALMAESHQADLVFGFDPASLQRLRHNPKVVLQEADVARTIVLKLNSGHRWLNTPASRQALSLAINRTGIAKGILRTPELAAEQFMPPSMHGWYQADADFPKLGTDLEKARGLLTAQGWKPGKDGILQKDGERFALTLTAFPDRPELPIVATALQDQFRQLGIDVKLVVTNSSEIPLGHRRGTLDMGLLALNFTVVPDPFIAMNQNFNKHGGDWGAMQWDNTTVPALLDKLATSTDEQANQRYQHDIMLTLQQELPAIPITWYRLPVAVHPELRGVKVDPLEQSYYLTDMYWPASAHQP
ncbi:ABC transporter substrate-binding protein [Methylobacillus methanolivorans]